jgi:hypothetical protein
MVTKDSSPAGQKSGSFTVMAKPSKKNSMFKKLLVPCVNDKQTCGTHIIIGFVIQL